MVGPAGIALLDRIEREVRDWPHGRKTLLDLGTGTGLLAIEAVTRWRNVTAVGMDPAVGMLELARERAEGLMSAADRLSWVAGTAEAMPFPNDSFDAVVCAFVYQLLTERQRALAEIRRVVRPGGVFGYVTWKGAPSPSMAADDALEAVLTEMNLEWEGYERPKVKRPASAASAASELRRAGFVHVAARDIELIHRFDRKRYLDQLEQDDATVTFSKVDRATRNEIRRRVRERWKLLGDDAFTMRRRPISVLARPSRAPRSACR